RGYLDQAVKYYERGLEINPDEADGYYYEGVAFLKQEQWAKAQALLEKALEKNPTHANAIYNLGKVAIEMGDDGGARKYFEESLKLVPDQADAYFGIGLVYFHENQYQKAAEYFEKAQISPNVEHEVVYYLGRIEEKTGNNASAERLYRRSVELRPGFGYPHLALGDLFRAGGRNDEARLEYQKAAIQREYPAIAKEAEERLSK
ncbi:MAG TPA: tetratricopeptide repeat protein, partial [bacterium]